VAGAGPELEDAARGRSQELLAHLSEAGALGARGEPVIEAGEDGMVGHERMIFAT
jgi:hypothetical protein